MFCFQSFRTKKVPSQLLLDLILVLETKRNKHVVYFVCKPGSKSKPFSVLTQTNIQSEQQRPKPFGIEKGYFLDEPFTLMPMVLWRNLLPYDFDEVSCSSETIFRKRTEYWNPFYRNSATSIPEPSFRKPGCLYKGDSRGLSPWLGHREHCSR